MNAEKEYLLHGEIPNDLADMIGKLVDGSFTRAIDPCVGKAAAFYRIARGWKSSGYGIEPEQMFSGPARNLLGFGNFLLAQFEDCVIRGFPLAYVNPPIEKRREINWIKRVWEIMTPGGIVVWVLPEKVTKHPDWLTKFSQYFGDAEAFRIPDGLKGPVVQLVIRARPRPEADLASDPVRIQMLIEACEKANILTSSPIAWALPPSVREHRAFTFKVRALEWDDIFRDLMQVSYPHIEEILDLPRFNHLESYRLAEETIKDQEKADKYRRQTGHDPRPFTMKPYTISDGAFMVWVDAAMTAGKEVLFLSMTGRLAHIRIVEMILKGGKQIKADYMPLVLDGKMRHWKKVYQNFIFRLPMSGAYQSIWVHTNMTEKVARSNQCVPMCKSKPALAARLLSAATGLPIMPEWIEDLGQAGSCFMHVADSNVLQMDCYPTKPIGDNIKLRMSALAKAKNLTEPTPGKAEIIRPLMPPSAGGYAQLALQQFINCFPLVGEEDDRIVLFAKPMVKEDVEISDVMNDKVEITTITRKDAVHVELFHYSGPRAGEWETFETGGVSVEEEEEDDEQTDPTQTP